MIVNLSEFAASGVNGISKSYLLDGYSGKNRQDNSRVHIQVKMTPQGSDPLFKVYVLLGLAVLGCAHTHNRAGKPKNEP